VYPRDERFSEKLFFLQEKKGFQKKGFVEVKDRFLSIWNHREAFSNHRNLFEGFEEKPIFVRV
jgi:hypothetical protein